MQVCVGTFSKTYHNWLNKWTFHEMNQSDMVLKSGSAQGLTHSKHFWCIFCTLAEHISVLECMQNIWILLFRCVKWEHYWWNVHWRCSTDVLQNIELMNIYWTHAEHVNALVVLQNLQNYVGKFVSYVTVWGLWKTWLKMGTCILELCLL